MLIYNNLNNKKSDERLSLPSDLLSFMIDLFQYHIYVTVSESGFLLK